MGGSSPVTQIRVRIVTGSDNGAGTDAHVYLGIGGREFYIDSNADDFENSADQLFKLGEDTNVKNPSFNDPRTPQMSTFDPTLFPVYLRMEPDCNNAAWQIDTITVTVKAGATTALTYSSPLLAGAKKLWLGQNYGKICYLS